MADHACVGRGVRRPCFRKTRPSRGAKAFGQPKREALQGRGTFGTNLRVEPFGTETKDRHFLGSKDPLVGPVFGPNRPVAGPGHLRMTQPGSRAGLPSGGPERRVDDPTDAGLRVNVRRRNGQRWQGIFGCGAIGIAGPLGSALQTKRPSGRTVAGQSVFGCFSPRTGKPSGNTVHRKGRPSGHPDRRAGKLADANPTAKRLKRWQGILGCGVIGITGPSGNGIHDQTALGSGGLGRGFFGYFSPRTGKPSGGTVHRKGRPSGHLDRRARKPSGASPPVERLGRQGALGLPAFGFVIHRRRTVGSIGSSDQLPP
jgi:hypothetical protein